MEARGGGPSLGRVGSKVLIAGGGVAALEAALALRELGGDRLELELCSPRAEFVYRPFAFGARLGATPAFRSDLRVVAERIGARFRLDGIAAVEPQDGVAIARSGARIPYDYLLVAVGAQPVSAVPGAVTFWGATDEGRLDGLVRRMRTGMLRELVFTMPEGAGWGPALYELALFGARVLARSGIEDARLIVATPEPAPLSSFGSAAGRRIELKWGESGIAVRHAVRPLAFEGGRLRTEPGEPIEAAAAIGLPRLEPCRIDGLTAAAGGFLSVGEDGRVAGTERVFAAGDVTDFPVKRAAIAAQQADLAAAGLTAAAGYRVEAPPPPAPRWPEPEQGLPGNRLGPFLAGRVAVMMTR